MKAAVKKPTELASGKTAGATKNAAGAVKPPPKAAVTASPAAKTGKSAAKSAVKSAATASAATASGAGAEPAASGTSPRTTAAEVAKPVASKRAVPAAASKAAPEDVQHGKHMSSNNASQGSGVKIDKTVVSKVSEVVTKTPKSAPAPVTDGALLLEAQILKMGEKDYMNAAQLAFFKARLQQLEKDLLKNAGETTEHLRETVLVPDPADRATIEEEHALELRTRDRERKLLKKVQQSIASIDTGDYGWCEETGEPIGIPRLLARPTATLSLEAQQRRELKQKLYGD